MYDVAVITPVYNTQDYLHRCIQSILSQKGVKLQVIAIDDGSIDNSAHILQHYQKRHDNLTVVSKANGGQGIARNLGIKLANAEFLYFVDSDDHLGESTLEKLYQAATHENLDICSPGVPAHYFEKPLEHVPCLPCKSQFIRSKIIKDFDIFQPDVSSGQDGVFSHLVLSHCERIGMLSDAEFHYTHAREGSTFAKHQKRPGLVPDILKRHYSAIKSHYDRWGLWEKNAFRLLRFVSDETLRNRVGPHFSALSTDQRRTIFSDIAPLVQQAVKHLPRKDKKLVDPIVLDIANISADNFCSDAFGEKLSEKQKKIEYPRNANFSKDKLYICKYSEKSLMPDISTDSIIPSRKIVETPIETAPSAPTSKTNSEPNIDTKAILSKLDFVLNTVNNASIQIRSDVRHPHCDLSAGHPDLVASVTTLPSRFGLVHLAIESIFSQALQPSKIVLWVSDKAERKSLNTPILNQLKKRGLEIRFVEDVGPHTKLMYALKAFPDKNIITFDDDIIYPNNMIETLWREHERHPNAVIANWARELAFDVNGVVQGVRSGRLLTPPNLDKDIEQAERYEGKPTMRGFPYGTSGVLYPTGALHEKVFDVKTFKELCPKEDDIWFRAMGIMNKTPVVPTNLGIDPKHYCVTGSQAEALRHDNHGLQQNKLQMQHVFRALNLYRYIKEPKR